MKKYFICVSLILFIFPSAIFAASNNLVFECESSKKKNQDINCDVYIDFDQNIISLEYKYKYNADEVTYKDFTFESGWNGFYDDGYLGLISESDNGVKEKVKVGVLTFTSNEKKVSPEIEDIKLSYCDNDDDCTGNIVYDYSYSVNNVEKKELKKASTSKNTLIYDIIYIIIGIVVVIGMGMFILIKIK